MRVFEITDDAPLVVKMLQQRLAKGEGVFFYDDNVMSQTQRIDSVLLKNGHVSITVHADNGLRTLIYNWPEIEDAHFRKRSADTWSMVIA